MCINTLVETLLSFLLIQTQFGVNMLKFLQRIFYIKQQSRLEQYLSTKSITDTGQLEQYMREYDRQAERGYI
jgi:hypothetical protein